jgi:hypothetical protein
MAIIGACRTSGIDIVGRDGFHWETLPAEWSLAFLAPSMSEMSYVRSISRDKRFAGHPIRSAMPTLRNMLYVPFEESTAEVDRRWALCAFDCQFEWPLSSALSQSLAELAFSCGRLVDHVAGVQEQLTTFETRAAAVHSRGVPSHEGLDAVTQFIAKTLISRTTWHASGVHGYTTIRKWRSAIKDHQVDAISALKQHPTSAFIDLMAKEIATAANHQVGRKNISAVVNVPCGHSKTNHCVSELLGRRVAEILDARHVDAFVRQHRPGKSHPRKNAGLPPFEFQKPVEGTVLLVDDIATSGQHLMRAAEALEGHADHAISIAWIGPG